MCLFFLWILHILFCALFFCFSQKTMGFECERFTCSTDRFICPICQDVLRDPVETPCNHVFCWACMAQQLKISSCCPVCNHQPIQPADLKNPHPFFANMHNELQIRCVHSTRGCQEVIALENITHHESKCGFAAVKCEREQCAKIVNRNRLEQHTK